MKIHIDFFRKYTTTIVLKKKDIYEKMKPLLEDFAKKYPPKNDEFNSSISLYEKNKNNRLAKVKKMAFAYDRDGNNQELHDILYLSGFFVKKRG